MMVRYSAGMFILISRTDETKYIPCNSIIMYINLLTGIYELMLEGMLKRQNKTLC